MARGNRNILRSGGLIAAACVVVLLAVVESCRPVPAPQPAAPSASTPLATSVPTPTATPQPLPATPVPTVAPKISQDEAQTVVNAWFNSVLAQDYATASDLTVGHAADQTRALSEGFQRATNGNAVQLAKQREDLSPGSPQGDGSQAVKADFDIAVNSQIGPIMVSVQRLSGSATFIVGRVGDRTRITDIQNVTGLPVAQQ